MAVAGLPVGAEAIPRPAEHPRSEVGLVAFGQDEKAAVVGDEAQAVVTLGLRPSDPLVAGLEGFGRGAEDPYRQPSASGSDRSVEHLFTAGLEAAEVVVLSEKGLESALVWEPGQLNDLDVGEGDRGGAGCLFSVGGDALHAPDGKKLEGGCSEKTFQPPSFGLPAAFMHARCGVGLSSLSKTSERQTGGERGFANCRFWKSTAALPAQGRGAARRYRGERFR